MKKKISVLFKIMLCLVVLFSAFGCTQEKKEDVLDVEKATYNKETDTTKEGKKIYFAGPMFNQGEKDFNLKITNILEEYGYEVFLPQRDGIEAALLEGKTSEEKTELIFEKDVSEILKADIVIMNIDGRVPDEGACVELGIAYANNKRCYGIMTDTRTIEYDLDINPMISGCFIKLFKDYDGDKLIEMIKEYLNDNEL